MGTTVSESATWTDPYKELELYLEKAHEEIGAVFHQLEASSRAAAAVQQPPPVPVRRHLHADRPRRPGLRVTEDYFIGDLEPPPGIVNGSNRAGQWRNNRKLVYQQCLGRKDGSFQRRISCPGLPPGGDVVDAGYTSGGGGGLAPMISFANDHARKQQPTNPRRHLRRYLTADSALQLRTADNGRSQPAYHPQAIQVWTSSLMAEFNHIIDGELQRLGSTPPSKGLDGERPERRLSPWAQMQLALIDPDAETLVPEEQQSPQCNGSKSASDLIALQADIDLVERQIFDDLDHLTLTLNQSLNQSSAESGHGSIKAGSDAELDAECTIDANGPTDDRSAHLSSVSSPVLRPQELQDFLRRVEDSIRTSNTTLDSGGYYGDEPLKSNAVTIQTGMDDGLASPSPLPPKRTTSMAPPAVEERPETPTFDAGTQTSPMSLSRSSSFLWVSDCNCSGSLDGSVPVAPPSAGSADSSGISRVVHMDTSMSSLVSESSGVADSDTRRRGMRTPDSADEDGRSIVSLDCGGGGVESGIGTGSPPPRDRRRRPIPPEALIQTETILPESDGSSTDEEPATTLPSSSSKKRDKVRRRETWEKIRRRHSCKRVHSRARKEHKTSEVVWIRRGQSETPPPVPPHAVPIAALVAAPSELKQDQPCMEPVLHKPPLVVIQSASGPRPKPRPFFFKNATLATDGMSPVVDSPCSAADSNLGSPSSSVKMALHAVLAMDLSAANKSSSTPFLKVASPRHLKPISASSTPTDPHMTMESGLAAARSHSESAFAELEATEACRWLRATGFPQYAQMYEDWLFPLDLNVVERDHPFLDVDSLQALFRRLATLNRMAKLRSEKARSRPQGGDESDDEDQECALSDQWTFQRHSRRWSRIVDLPDDPAELAAMAAGNPSGAASSLASGQATPTTAEDTSAGDPTNDPVILGSFRRSSSERLRHGAKSLLRRMESLRSRSRRRPVLVRPADGSLVISGPQLVDATSMEDRMKDLNCVDLSGSASPTSSTPSPDLNRIKAELLMQQKQQSLPPAMPSPLTPETPTPSPGGSMKIKRGFFGRRSFRPSSSGRRGSDPERKDGGTHSDSEYSPGHNTRLQRSPSTPKDANSNETTTWSSLEQSLRWKAKKSREPIDADVVAGGDTARGKLFLNFSRTSQEGRTIKNAGSLLSSPDDDDNNHSVSTPMGIRPPSETPTPSGSLRDGADRLMDTFGLQNDSASTGTGTSGSHADSDYSPAATGRTPIVTRWHSFRRSSSTSSVAMYNPQPMAIKSLSVGQFALLRKLALLRLTALLERHASSSKPSWGWDLPKFMRKAKSPDYKDKSMFGVPLSVTVQRTGEALPRPIMAALHYLRQSALDQVGLFRKSGVRSRIAKLKELCEAWAWQCAGPAGGLAFVGGTNGIYDDDNPVDFGEHQPYDVADMVKQYFRELPEALMTNKLSETFVTIFQVVPADQRSDALRCALLLLPDEHREALQTFLAFLTDVAALASVNQMTPSNLAVCLAPSLFHLPATSSGSIRSDAIKANGGGAAAASSNAASSNNSNASSPRRRKTVGVPDQRELSQNKAAHDCLLQMINDFNHLFTVPEEIFRQCRNTLFEDNVPVSLDDLRTVEFGDWQAYMNGCMASLLKETKDKTRGWESMNNDLRVDVAWKKVGDGHPLRLWKVTVEIEAPPGELLNRVLRERHLWDPSIIKWRTIVRLDKKSDVFHFSTTSEVPPISRDVTLLRSWRTDLPRGTCLVAEMSIDHHDAPVASGTVRTIALASRYLIQPCGAGKCRLVHLSRVDIMGRSLEWYNKHYGHVSALHLARIRDSFSQHLVAEGPESKV